jgi:RNA polymerase sigma-70 factor (ECF subfamily)
MDAEQTPIPRPLEPGDESASPHRQPLSVLLDQVMSGCPEAAEQLQQQYGEYIVRAVRRRLPRTLRPRFDSIDFVQDVWASFFRAPEHDFSSPEHLIAFLSRVAQNKVIDAAREGLQTIKRDTSREQPLALYEGGQQKQKLFAREATPSETAIGDELWARLLKGQRPVYRQVLLMLRDGQTQEEVAEELKLSRKTVQRVLAQALERATRATQ